MNGESAVKICHCPAAVRVYYRPKSECPPISHFHNICEARMLNAMWHGYGEDWVPHFMREYQIEISSLAWSGYQTQGKGMMICEVDCPREGRVWDLKTVRHHFSYAPITASVQHLQRLELPQSDISNLTDHLQTYDPKQEAIVLMTGKGEILVALVRNLALAEIYDPHQSRSAEFSLQPNPPLNMG